MSESKSLLMLDSITKTYEASAGAAATPVLKGIDLCLDPGESVAIIGPSGSGKSTLLNIIGTLDRPTHGKVILDGKDLSALNEQELALLRNRDIGLVFQLHHLLPQCSVMENVLVPTLVGNSKQRAEEPKARAHRLLERVGLVDRLSHRPGQLSGGERQRVALVRALINEPGLLLADEPTGSLDRAAADNLGNLLVEINREEGVALIVSTHAIPLAARMSRVLELREGSLVPAWDVR